MSRPISRLHPYEVADHPQLEPEVKRAILASWEAAARRSSKAEAASGIRRTR